MSRFWIFVLSAVALTALLVGLGSVPARGIAGPAGPAALAAGCLVGLVAALVGSQVVLLGKGRAEVVVLAFGAMGARLLVLVLCGAALLFATSLPRPPLLIGIGVSYLVLLPLETWFLLKEPAASGKNDLDGQV